MKSLSTFCLLAVLFCASETAFSSAVPPPDPDQALFASAARAWIRQGNYDEAMRALRQIMKRSHDPDFAYAYLYCLYETGAYGRLLALVHLPRYSAAVSDRRGRILLGLTYWRSDKTLAALPLWLEVLRRNPRDQQAWECIRVALLSCDRRIRTLAAARVLSALRDSKFASYFVLGLLDFIRNRPESAENRLLEARSLDPENLAAARALRYLYRQTGNMREAQKLDRWIRSRERPDEQASETPPPREAEIGPPTPQAGRDKVASAAVVAPYRLPWPGGLCLYCGSHAGRRSTPHSGRGRYALDFFLPMGTPVLAARGGIVEKVCDRHAVFKPKEFGTFVLINHGDGTWGRYYHLRGGSIRVRRGQVVRQGDILGESGRTGRCQSRHLHFEVVRKARPKLSGPKIYRFWRTIPVDFEETRDLRPEQIPGRWLVSRNRMVPLPKQAGAKGR